MTHIPPQQGESGDAGSPGRPGSFTGVIRPPDLSAIFKGAKGESGVKGDYGRAGRPGRKGWTGDRVSMEIDSN